MMMMKSTVSLSAVWQRNQGFTVQAVQPPEQGTPGFAVQPKGAPSS